MASLNAFEQFRSFLQQAIDDFSSVEVCVFLYSIFVEREQTIDAFRDFGLAATSQSLAYEASVFPNALQVEHKR